MANNFKMGRWGWAGVAFVLGLGTFWAITGFKNPLEGMMGSSKPKAGDKCTTGDNQAGTVQADLTCKV